MRTNHCSGTNNHRCLGAVQRPPHRPRPLAAGTGLPRAAGTGTVVTFRGAPGTRAAKRPARVARHEGTRESRARQLQLQGRVPWRIEFQEVAQGI
eukprot:gene18594-biopygen5435